MPGSAPVAPTPLAGANTLKKGKTDAGTQEHILSGLCHATDSTAHLATVLSSI